MDIVTYILIGVGVVFLAGLLSVANFSDNQLREYYNMQFNEIAYSNQTSKNFFDLVNNAEFNSTLRLEQDNNVFGGIYYTSKRCVKLSDEIYDSGSITALTVTAHELGHAVQSVKNRDLILKNYKFSIFVKFLGKTILPLLIASIVLLFFNLIASIVLISLCFIIFILALLLKYSGIKIENQASNYAIQLLIKYDVMSDEQLVKAKKLLKYAKQTYIANFLSSMLFWTFMTKKTNIF